MKQKEYWITNSRYKLIFIGLMFIFILFMGVIVWQGENISKDPCGICASRMSEEVSCSFADSNGKIFHRVYYPNQTVIDLSEFIGGN